MTEHEPSCRYDVCIPTFRRAAQLERLLASLSDMIDDPRWERDGVIIVDNDPGESAAPIAERWSDRIPGLRYVVEPRPGVAAVRNRLIEASTAPWMLFIDDDEEIVSDWPIGLQQLASETACHAVAGPVALHVSDDCPRWMLRPHFLGRPPRPHGSVQSTLPTGNLLLGRAAATARTPAFDTSFSTTGSEDSEFTQWLSDHGFVLRWSAKGVVAEVIPPDRERVSYLVNRWHRIGANMARIEVGRCPTGWPRTKRRARLVGAALVRSVAGALLAPLLLVRRRGEAIPLGAEGLRNLCYFTGSIRGALGGASAWAR